MNRRELVAELAERLEIDKRTADTGLQAFVDIVTDTVASGEVVAISGFAKFARVERAARMGRNPQTGEAIRIKASRRGAGHPAQGVQGRGAHGQAPGEEGPGQEGRARQEGRGEEGSGPEGRAGEEGRRQEDGRPQGARQEDRGEEDHAPLATTHARSRQ